MRVLLEANFLVILNTNGCRLLRDNERMSSDDFRLVGMDQDHSHMSDKADYPLVSI